MYVPKRNYGKKPKTRTRTRPKRKLYAKSTGLAKRIRALERGVEKKVIEGGTSGGVDWNGDIFILTQNIAQGLNAEQRVGDKITSLGVSLRGRLTAPMKTTAADSFCIPTAIRVVVYCVKPFNGSPGTAMPPFWIYNGTDLGTTVAPLASRNLDFAPQVQILYDKLYRISGANETVLIDDKIKFRKPITTTYGKYNTTEMGCNQIYMLIVSDRDQAASSFPSYRYDIDFWYTDA